MKRTSKLLKQKKNIEIVTALKNLSNTCFLPEPNIPEETVNDTYQQSMLVGINLHIIT